MSIYVHHEIFWLSTTRSFTIEFDGPMRYFRVAFGLMDGQSLRFQKESPGCRCMLSLWEDDLL